jgi:UDP-N-acetylmuramate--alanine ligase
MLAELMRLQFSFAVGGTHGKTTTTSMVAALLDAGGLDPTVVNGGISTPTAPTPRWAWRLDRGGGRRSDGSLPAAQVTPWPVVPTSTPSTLDHYGDFDAIRKPFRDFVREHPFYGFAAVCLDHPEVQAMAAAVENRRLVTYGINPQAEVRALRVEMDQLGAQFDVCIQPRDREPRIIDRLRLPMPGWHNVSNALAAIAVARELGVSDEAIREGLAGFVGVKRRFTTTGVVGGVRIIDDYGHHPVEITAVLKAARQVASGKVIAVVQPHRYTRLRDLFDDFCAAFNDADQVIVADVYAAGEAPIEGIDRDALVDGLRRWGHRNVTPLDGAEALPDLVREAAQDGDLVVCLGAGDITSWAYALPEQLAARAVAA